VRSVYSSFLITHVLNLVPIIVVFTKLDELVNKLEYTAKKSGKFDKAALEVKKSDTLNELCIQPLQEVAGTDILHTIVSSKGVLLFWYPILTYHYSEERVREHHKTTNRPYNHERRKIC
jgi:hypothetical protein